MPESRAEEPEDAIDPWAVVWWFEGDARVELFPTEAAARAGFAERAQGGWRVALFERRGAANEDKGS